jgi:hypothetical protein
MCNHFIRVIGFIAFFLVLFCPLAKSEPITFYFTGELIGVTDNTPNLVLGDQFSIGDAFSGIFTYDLSAIDGGPPEYAGAYHYNALPTGISISTNGLNFSSDPDNVNINISTYNDMVNVFGEMMDQFSFHVNFNVIFPVPTGIGSSISIILQDWTATALENDSLPTDLYLPSWEVAYFQLSSNIGPHAWDYYSILGEIHSITPQNPIPEPTTMLLLASGLMGLAGLRRKFRKR